MRTLTYKVRNCDGEIFTTASYSIATNEGNTIVRTYLVPCESRNEKIIKGIAERSAKILGQLKARA